MAKLCGLPPGSTVNRAWLATVWPKVSDVRWLDQFWDNQKDDVTKVGARAKWCNDIAAATTAEKQKIQELLTEQLRFKELYDHPPTLRLTFHNWKGTVMSAVNNLLESFYTKLFYKSIGIGFPSADGSRFFNRDYIGEGPAVCPYTDGSVHDTTLDHFLPKDQFPMLSCHPDNLIPCSTDANKGSHKGAICPLDEDEQDQAANWFHPRLRSAIGSYTVTFDWDDPSKPQARIEALAADDHVRVQRLESMFGLRELWSKALMPEVHFVAGEIRDVLQEDSILPSVPIVRAKLKQWAKRKRNRIGHDPLAIRTTALYEHILHDAKLFANVMDTCRKGVR